MVFLVTGGSGKFGSQVVNELRKREHVVYSAQRSGIKSEDINYNLEYWKKIDFDDPSEIAMLVQQLLKVKLDGVIFLHRAYTAIPINQLGPFDIQHEIRINVLASLMLVRYLFMFEVLNEGGRVVFPLNRKTDISNDYVAYKIANAVLPSAIEIGLDDIIGKLKHCYVILEECNEAVIEKLANLLDGTEEIRERMVDLRTI